MDSTTKKKATRIAMFIGTIGVSAALVGAGVAATGAYFSDTNSGTITGTLGSIKVTTSGGTGTDSLDFNFANLLPGETQKADGRYTNTGRNAQDVWIVFNNADALHALNNLGSFGEVHIVSNGTDEVFASTNLNDNLAPASGTCGPFSPAPGMCWPLPRQIKLADNVNPGLSGEFSFSFRYPAKMGNIPTSGIGDGQGSNIAGAIGPEWNRYPLGSPISSGLPYQIVATQDGITPGQQG
jgi:hypothetical protein